MDTQVQDSLPKPLVAGSTPAGCAISLTNIILYSPQPRMHVGSKWTFDHLNHDEWQKFVAQTTDNPWCRRYIKRWIVVGVNA